ncbi:hypothetical protein WR25_18063 [Diploscapter pachys]|uniref:Fibrinogen C-terminal domain-containing protein n=1 Tax=Diploscapter pachys TaxID=2018661 RepID=A0A2A2JEI1_9BILA|nr:hypothetical protein WR25_18063 [Diploscapter pachys]
MRTFRNMRNKWSDRVLTVRFVISVVENPQGQEISSKFGDRLPGNFEQNEFSNGIYTVIVGNASVDVYCDMVTYNGGWTLFQSRVDGSYEFWDKSWAQYRDGFGDGIGDGKNYWLGLSKINLMTVKNAAVTLRIEMVGDGTPGAALPNGY